MTDKVKIKIGSLKWLLPKCKYAMKCADKGLLLYRLGLLIDYTEDLIKALESEVEE